MRVLDIINSDHVTVSCELFPPKLGKPLRDTERIVAEIARLKPSFISVTCGAGGSTGDHTVEIARCVQKDNGVTALAHVTCVSTPRAQIHRTLTLLREAGVENILALRGDLPADGSPACADFAHASDLIEEINRFGGFCVGGACYPEGHPESPNKQADLDGIRKKVDSGCAFLTTQMFFDNNILYNFLFRLLKHGINVPVVAGIMPITNVRQVKRTFALSGANLPPRFRAIVDRFGDDPAAMKQAGIAYATEQIIDLIANGVSHVHIYTMNQPDIAGTHHRQPFGDFPVTAFERETLRYLGNAKADERLMALIASVEAELRSDVRPRGVHRRLPIVVSEGRVAAGGHVFESSALAKNLCGCREAFFLAATLGAEADRRLRRFSALDLPRAAVWQAGCAAYLEEYIDGMEDGLRREAPGLYLRPRFSPGYGDLDISHQRAMFDLLELEKRLGLSLTQTHMMLPEKSVTAIAGLSDVPGARVGGCAACAKTDCPNRRKDA